MTTQRVYPEHREADVALKDGSTVHIRPIRQADEKPLADFIIGLSERSRWFRFFSAWANIEEFAQKAVDADYLTRLDLVVTAGRADRIIGHATYVTIAEGRAEVAFAVEDTYQGKGIGTILLGHLAEAAQDAGIEVFEAVTLPENHRMIDVFRDSGFPVRTWSEPGEIHVEFPTSLSPEAIERFDRREQAASVAATQALLCPGSIAVLGASRHRETIGGAVFHNLVTGGFNGPVYPVNPNTDVVQSVRAYPSISDVPGDVDLAVIVVPAASVVDAARECAEVGVRGLIVISAGFSEVGDEGRARQRELLRVCRESGMRLIGPNCLGAMNTSESVSMNATFGPQMPPSGRVGFMTQSGALGLAVIDRAAMLGLGLSTFVSVGNKADISGNDLISYWDQDPETDLILLYLESFGNPVKFARLARRVGRTKPILAVKSGRSTAGARATSSHTGALIAASDVTVNALFEQAGVVRCDTLAELFDVAALLANQPAARGDRVAIVTNAGGPGILAADACEAEGLNVVDLPDEVKDQLRSFLPAEAALHNPIDMIASASAEDYRRTIETVAACPDVDAVIVIFIPPLVTRAEEVAAAIQAASVAITRPLPLLTVFMSAHGVPEELGGRLPSYAFPEDASRALARTVRYGLWREEPEGEVPTFPNVRGDEGAGVIASALERGGGWLGPDEVASLLDCYGIPLAEQQVATTPEEAGRAAAEIGGTVALKAVAPELIHKSDVGGVRLDLPPGEVESAATDIAERVTEAGATVERFLVQEMVSEGVEMLVGVVHDPLFGPVVAIGSGGTAVELVKDVNVRITPLTTHDAEEMIRTLKTFPLLDGYRGAPKADVAALTDVLGRVATLVDAHPEVAEMDCNPVIVRPTGAAVVDARIRVEAPRPKLPLGARRRD